MHIKLVKSSVLAAVAAAGTSSIAVADTIDFEDVAVADGTYSNETPSFESGGFTFSQAPAANSALNLQNDFFNGQDFFGDTTGDIGHNGTTTIWSYGSVLTMAQSDGVAFNLLSLEAAEMFSATFTSDRIDVTGHLAGGGTVTTTLVLDGAYDGDGGVDDFELFTFDASWSNLTSVDFIGLNGTTYDDFGLDDIQLTLVPLPQAALMGLAGLGGVAGLKRRRRDLSTRPLKRA